MTIDRLLVANRGEIARRVLRSAAALGVQTVAVYADPDAGAPHVAEADRAVRLPGGAPADTYLRSDALVAAARASGADAVHPGYGFLSESAAFARAVAEAGLTWVGPPPEAIAAMADKRAAKKAMRDAGVPVLPELDPAAVTEADFPLLVKAAAGGGGRGMRAVAEPAALPAAVGSARREAESAFGDGSVFCEPLLRPARHVEVQVLADAHGTVWTLGERECSAQRRHQKVVEESPSPAVGPALRERLCEAAVRAARAIGYVGAGTVEFLLGGDPADPGLYFLEVNTRLQVEHPVTEARYRLDLVAWQLRIAEGARLPAEPPRPHGHAVEARLYAEDPAAGWRPAAGPLHRFEVPGADAGFAVAPADSGTATLRVDAGVVSGSVVPTHYDPMLAKVVAWAPDRPTALRRLAAALAGARVHGPATNRDVLVRLLRHPVMRAGGVDTGFLEGPELAGLSAPLADGETVRLAALAAALAAADRERAAAGALGTLPGGWRNVVSAPQCRAFDGPTGRIEVRYRSTRDGTAADGYGEVRPAGVVRTGADEHSVVLECAGVRQTFAVAHHASPGGGTEVWVDTASGAVALRPLPRLPEPEPARDPGSLLAPMPGSVARVLVSVGEAVAAGQPLLVLEAMKMEHPVAAPAAGRVRELYAGPGAQVGAGAVLAVLDAPAADGPAGFEEGER
ncbi:biotin carboxylase N-terminal domain-containing protein [Allonocardiopsis opalescens]|uniref:Propionyl-CoA carboxylase alpha chain n=1 Tax=Allonocardiopsis opalescens TaxID=1144618 RepID=A0A2T0Q468_9ACTN|nr:biotin carboxylase N-terminal domain-containing protein [Allonocardiopsis opalescens]PRX98596.1 propionyl-CoA carboxylase alpha chain [Allonocardiopsis opalescens]